MLCRLSLKNIRKSVKDYAIYFFTLILGVAIFYVFNSIESQTVMMNVSKYTYQIIDMMNSILSGVSVFVSCILGFLIIYASRFLIKRRNKEFGIYLTLGMSKRKISLILFFETLFIGIISLGVGLLVGVCLSQLMSILVANMFEADMTRFKFVFSSSAFVKTIIYFAIIYLFVMVFNTINVSRCKLIDLLHANRKSEKIKLKNPAVCTVIFIVSAAVLGYAYYLVTGGIEKMESMEEILIPIALGSISTFFIFWSLSGLLLRMFMSVKKLYYKDLNSFTLRQISSKINTTVFSMTIICLMLFVTICVFSSSLSLKNSLTSNLKTLVPSDIQVEKYVDNSEKDNDYHISARELIEKYNFDTEKYFKDTVEFNVYSTEELTMRKALGSHYEEIIKDYPYLAYNESEEQIVKVSEYNELAKLFDMDEITLDGDEYAVVANFKAWVEIRNDVLKDSPEITINGNKYKPAYDECKDGFIYMSSNFINMGIFVVPDDAVIDSMCCESMLTANYNADKRQEREAIEDRIDEMKDYSPSHVVYPDIMTKMETYAESVGLGAMVTFIGLYLGIIFLISSAAILALKELSESSDNKERFNMLRKIGTDEKMINRALFRQIAIFFMFPLLIAIIHSIFGIKFCNFILSTFGDEHLLPSLAMTSVFLVVIYGGYFVITYLCSKNIIKNN